MGPNKRFELRLMGDQTGLKLGPAHAPNLCSSLEPGTGRVEQRVCTGSVEQRVCTGSVDQRWYVNW
jgi:hypothetical protein